MVEALRLFPLLDPALLHPFPCLLAKPFPLKKNMLLLRPLLLRSGQRLVADAIIALSFLLPLPPRLSRLLERFLTGQFPLRACLLLLGS